jgi:hypothetical protein
MMISDEVKRLARAGVGKTIHAIKVLRSETGINLALAKEIVETIAAGGEVQLAAPPHKPQSSEPHDQRIRRQLEALREAGRATEADPERTERLIGALHGNEDLLGLVHGTYWNRRGLLAVSQERLLFMSEEVDSDPAVEEFALENIYLVHHRAGVRTSSINIFICAGDRVEFTDIDRDQAGPFTAAIKERGEYPVDAIYDLSADDELARHEALYDRGYISNEEIAEARRRLLDLRPKGGESKPASRRRPH